MAHIQRLSRPTIGKIAAGEVVERPAAVAKELIENAIDAGASRVDVVIEQGGVALIEVSDNGEGIPFEDLELALERHATSKLRAIEDLSSIATLGFRGEALASIAAVSDLTIQSITPESRAGGMARVRFGNQARVDRSPWGAGTSVRVKDLFENVPARRSFLRQPRTEVAYIETVVTAHALAYPQIAFSLAADGDQLLATDGLGDSIGAAAGVWGHEYASQLCAIEPEPHRHEGYRISGIIGLPSISRARRDRLFTFVQGRFVQNRQIATAVEQAYHSLLMVGRRPVGCLVVLVPPDRIDVNVHPTKSEVRFTDDRIVFALVQRAVRHTLAMNVAHQPIPTVIHAPLGPLPSSYPGSQSPSVQRMLSLADPMRLPRSSLAQDAVDEKDDAHSISAGRKLPALRVLGQVASAFIIAEGPDGLYLVDQHAAHERILFEKIMNERSATAVARQRLLEPAIVELSARQMQMLEDCKDDLHLLGFEIEEFGDGSVALRSVPAAIGSTVPAETLLVVLDEMLEGGRGDYRLESLAISAACHGSIRAGQPLSLIEMRELVLDLERCESSLACGHGRPTIIRMTTEELARQFSRR